LSLFSDLYIGLSGLNLAERQMTVVGQNEANATTPDYHDETVSAVANPLAQGGGATILSIDRKDDPFLDADLRSAVGTQAYWQQEQTTLSQLEGVIAPGDQAILQGPIDNFFAAWNTLANNPENAAARAQVIATGQALVEAFQSVNQGLTNIAQDLANGAQNLIGQVNADLQAVASLNSQIAQHGFDPSLADQRDKLAQDLAQLAGFQARPEADGSLTILDQGTPVVTRGQADTLTVNLGPPPSLTSQLYGPLPAPGAGQLGAVLDLAANAIPNIENQLNNLVQAIDNAVNTQHQAGYDLSGNPGQPFFTGAPTLSGIQVNPAIAANPNLLAAASSATTPADGQNAAAIYALASPAAGTPSFDDTLASIVGALGVQAQTAQDQLQQANTAQTAAVQAWQNVSGVDLNTEAANLLLEEKAFEGSAEYIQVLNTTMGYLLAIPQTL
jgi:flagellar hook-associated protein 1 FlgK